MDGIETSVGVIVVAATNRVHAIDPALLRPGRFDAIVQVPLPSPPDRADILRIHTRDMALARDVDLTYHTGMAAPLCTGTNMRMVLRQRPSALGAAENCPTHLFDTAYYCCPQHSVSSSRASYTIVTSCR